MKAAVAISYFHRKIGPMVFYSYPEDMLLSEEKARLADGMDQAYEEGFFTHKFSELASMNYYFEIESKFARGKKEMLMISFIMDSNPNSVVEGLIIDFCNAFANRLKMNKEIYKSFYSVDDSQVSPEDAEDIKKYREDLQFWVRELYWMGIEELRERTEEEKWATVMAKPEIFKVIKKISKGPLSLEDLKKWFDTVFPEYSLEKILDELEEEKFIFVNQIGLDTYVLLVKEVFIQRVPPNCIIDLEEGSSGNAELTEIYINEVRDFFEFYQPTPLDSLELFKLIANPKIYNVISQLREGPLPREKILSMVSESSSKLILGSLDLLQENSIIQAFSYSNILRYMLKTDIVLTASFPEYLRRLLPKETKGYIARAYSHRPLINQDEEILNKIRMEKEREQSINKLISISENPAVDSQANNPITDDTQEYYEHGTEYRNQKIAELQRDLLKKLMDETEN